MRNQTDGSTGLAAALGRSSSAFGEATEAQSGNLDVAEKWATAFAAANVVYTGLMDNIRGTMGIFGTMGDLAKGGFGIMQSAIGVLVAPFQGLMQMGAEYNNDMAGKMFTANNKVVESFGDLKGPAGGFVKQMKKDLIPVSYTHLTLPTS